MVASVFFYHFPPMIPATLSSVDAAAAEQSTVNRPPSAFWKTYRGSVPFSAGWIFCSEIHAVPSRMLRPTAADENPEELITW